MKRQIRRIQTLPRALALLTHTFSTSVIPYAVEFDVIWGLIYLTLKLSYTSPVALRRITDVLDSLRRKVELFTGVLESCRKENEARISTVDFLDPFLEILTDLVEYLVEYSERSIGDMWPEVYDRVVSQLSVLDTAARHVNDLTNLSKANRELEVQNLTLRHALIPEDEEKGQFPVQSFPFKRNPKFYGRQTEIAKILECLRPKGDNSFRTFTIYGRRGVGKTQVALQFGYTNISTYDAIFWIQCETSVTIRQSFNDVAVSLNIPAADRAGRDEENLVAIQSWLKKTTKKWLLIFDNVENAKIMKSYWPPPGTSGAVLITSRLYHNFIKEECREGATIKPFDPKQSWELLLELLGGKWKQLDQEEKIPDSEVVAAKSMVKDLEGLALAIVQTSVLIRDASVGGMNIAVMYEMFKARRKALPERQSTPRSPSERSLDALWDMIFRPLTTNARLLMGVLAWLSPDAVPMRLFLPTNQSALGERLTFCRKDVGDLNSRTSFVNIIKPSAELERVVQELLDRSLINQDNQILSIHREVQEAVNYHDQEDLQKSFEAASRLVFEQFPKREKDETLYSRWSKCAEYIAHVIYLSKRYTDYSRVLKGSPELIMVLSNAAWYLYEIGDYDACNRVAENGIIACGSKTARLYAGLRLTQGACLFELNRLMDCRKAWEDAQRVRTSELRKDEPGIAAMYNNLGNLELAVGEVEKAMENYEHALLIWVNWPTSALQLAITYLCVGRLHTLQGNYSEALKFANDSNELVETTIGPDKAFMVYVQYAFGNIHFLQDDLDVAWKYFDSCLKIGLSTMPIHPVTAAAWYSLACVEFARGNLDAALVISALRSPAREDGPIVRTMWKKACVLEQYPEGKHLEEAKDLKRRAERLKETLTVGGEGGTVPFADEEGRERNQEEDSYDALVPLFYR
ncbi:hypothetical protein IFR05_002682 [Cadophora sp. M221]|nr:hypothetical protein IFR05_002682 [Cadophora sp. M221]